MNRRRFLAELGGAGVVGLGGCGAPPTATSDRRRSTAATAGPEVQRRVSIATQDAVPGDADVRIEPRLLESQVTAAHTARLRLTFSNDGARRATRVSTGRCALLNRYSQSSRPRGVWLARWTDRESTYVTEAGPRWVASPPEGGAFPDYGCSGRTYVSGESVSTEYGVFDDARSGGYLPPGAYRFERRVRLEPAASTERDPQERTEFDWGFVLRVEAPG